MIRIAQVVEAVEGGCKKHVLDLVCGLDNERFHQTVLFSTHRDVGFEEQVRAATAGRAETICCEFRREIVPRSDLAAYRFLRHLFQERDFDIIHCHSAKAGLLGRLAARGLRAATLYTPHCFPFQMHTSPVARQAYLYAERLAGRYTDRLVAVSPSEAEIGKRLRVVPPDRVVTIENGINPLRLRQGRRDRGGQARRIAGRREVTRLRLADPVPDPGDVRADDGNA